MNYKIIEDIRKRLSYDPATGVCVWVTNNKHHPRLLNKPAGTIRKTRSGPRVYIKICKKGIPRSRVAFVIMTGKIPNVVDHINGNTLDDRWINIRDVSILKNRHNVADKIKKNGLPTGVKKMGKSFQVRIANNRKTVYGGCFNTVDEAKKEYEKLKKELHGQFSRGYNE